MARTEIIVIALLSSAVAKLFAGIVLSLVILYVCHNGLEIGIS